MIGQVYFCIFTVPSCGPAGHLVGVRIPVIGIDIHRRSHTFCVRVNASRPDCPGHVSCVIRVKIRKRIRKRVRFGITIHYRYAVVKLLMRGKNPVGIPDSYGQVIAVKRIRRIVKEVGTCQGCSISIAGYVVNWPTILDSYQFEAFSLNGPPKLPAVPLSLSPERLFCSNCSSYSACLYDKSQKQVSD